MVSSSNHCYHTTAAVVRWLPDNIPCIPPTSVEKLHTALRSDNMPPHPLQLRSCTMVSLNQSLLVSLFLATHLCIWCEFSLYCTFHLQLSSLGLKMVDRDIKANDNGYRAMARYIELGAPKFHGDQNFY